MSVATLPVPTSSAANREVVPHLGQCLLLRLGRIQLATPKHRGAADERQRSDAGEVDLRRDAQGIHDVDVLVVRQLAAQLRLGVIDQQEVRDRSRGSDYRRRPGLPDTYPSERPRHAEGTSF